MDRFLEFIVNHWILSGTFAALLVAWFLLERARSGQLLSPQMLTLLLNRETGVVVDIREKKEFSEGHIKGSVHIPLASLKERVKDLEKYKDKQIILVDKMGQHSATAAKLLREAGIENIARLQGGIAEWRNGSLPVSKK
ncbi:MAG: rhodanese-like domain-containing protein [Hahellaceae bacterium]|nr:rhodanese-like domain-containing protein [Hahellaceae bacterium]MCP5211028.1 rhodanese-like domain-containing protein [Hahellaceae bacterium]